MKVAEKFISINGEGTRAGELAVFLRFAGCNLWCSFCDTAWARDPDSFISEETPAELAEFVRSTGIRNVTLTGGEPLLQDEMPELVTKLLDIPGVRVEIETNGAVSLAALARLRERDRRLTFTMDYKLPESGCEDEMLVENFSYLTADDTVKFVSGSAGDLGRAAQVIKEYGLTGRCHVYISPVFGAITPREIVEFMLARRLNDVRLQLQLHKIIWDPNRRGV